jgi:hypothetical protein
LQVSCLQSNGETVAITLAGTPGAGVIDGGIGCSISGHLRHGGFSPV